MRTSQPRGLGRDVFFASISQQRVLYGDGDTRPNLCEQDLINLRTHIGDITEALPTDECEKALIALRSYTSLGDSYPACKFIVESDAFPWLLVITAPDLAGNYVIPILGDIVSCGIELAHTAIHRGLLKYCLDRDILNEGLCFVLFRDVFSKLLNLSIFTRGLIYSTDILRTMLERLGDDEVLPRTEETSAKILLQFLTGGPFLIDDDYRTPGPYADSMQVSWNVLDKDRIVELWQSFVETSEHNGLFSWDLMVEFYQNGIHLGDNGPFFYLVRRLLHSSYPSTITILMEGIYSYLVSNNHPLEVHQMFISGPLAICEHIPRYQELGADTVHEYVMNALVGIYKHPKISDDTRFPEYATDYAVWIIHMAMQKRSDDDESPTMEGAAVNACYAIINLVLTEPSERPYKQENDLAERLIRNEDFKNDLSMMMNGSCKEQEVALWLRLTLAEESIKCMLDSAEVSHIISCMYGSNANLIVRCLNSLGYLIERDEKHGAFSPQMSLKQLFLENGGEDLIEELRESELESSIFQDDDGNAVLVSDAAETFYDKFILEFFEEGEIEPLPNFGLPQTEEEEEELEYFH